MGSGRDHGSKREETRSADTWTREGTCSVGGARVLGQGSEWEECPFVRKSDSVDPSPDRNIFPKTQTEPGTLSTNRRRTT